MWREVWDERVSEIYKNVLGACFLIISFLPPLFFVSTFLFFIFSSLELFSFLVSVLLVHLRYFFSYFRSSTIIMSINKY